MSKPKNFSSGFSLIEVILSVAIISIVSFFSLSFYARFFSANALSNSVDQLVASLRKAQVYTVTGKEGSQWGVALDNSKIVLFSGSNFAARNTAFDETFSVDASVSVSGLTEVVFSKITGEPSLTSAITISANNSSKNVTINSLGVVSR